MKNAEKLWLRLSLFRQDPVLAYSKTNKAPDIKIIPGPEAEKAELVTGRRMQPGRFGLYIITFIWLLVLVPLSVAAAPYAAFVMDARTGEVIEARNADTRLHPASLTKMMTLYIAFEAVQNGEITMDTEVRISAKAASEPPSRLGLKAGQTIKLRYLVRAAAVKSANDAATAIGEAIAGSEAAFARRMNRTAAALGMTRSTFKNAHGLTESGHLSTARDMSILGRHLIYDYPMYYNLFGRKTTDAGIREVSHTNRRLLESYAGADGIKTGYTSAAGFNLVASAERGSERVVATVFGGRSSSSRNAQVAELLDLGFKKMPTRVAFNPPRKPAYVGPDGAVVAEVATTNPEPGLAAKSIRVASAAVKRSLVPQMRPGEEPQQLLVAEAIKGDLQALLAEAQAVQLPSETPVNAEQIAQEVAAALPTGAVAPQARPDELVLASVPDAAIVAEPAAPEQRQVVTRISTSGGRHWGINVGRYNSQYAAEKALLQTALLEMETLDGTLRKVAKRPKGFDANFMGLSREMADLACRRLQARQMQCFMIGPS